MPVGARVKKKGGKYKVRAPRKQYRPPKKPKRSKAPKAPYSSPASITGAKGERKARRQAKRISKGKRALPPKTREKIRKGPGGRRWRRYRQLSDKDQKAATGLLGGKAGKFNRRMAYLGLKAPEDERERSLAKQGRKVSNILDVEPHEDAKLLLDFKDAKPSSLRNQRIKQLDAQVRSYKTGEKPKRRDLRLERRFERGYARKELLRLRKQRGEDVDEKLKKKREGLRETKQKLAEIPPRTRTDRRRSRRKSRQNEKLRRLTQETIPRLEARRRDLSTPGIAPTPLVGKGPEATRKLDLAKVERQLAKARKREMQLKATVGRRKGRRAEGESALEVGLALASALPPLGAARAGGLGARALLKATATKAVPAGVRKTAPKAAKAAGKLKGKVKPRLPKAKVRPKPKAAPKAPKPKAPKGKAPAPKRAPNAEPRPPRAKAEPAKAPKARPSLRSPKAWALGKGATLRPRKLGKLAPALRAAGTAASYPARRPFKTAAVATFGPSVPEAVRERDLEPLSKALSGQGTAAKFAISAGNAVASLAPGELGKALVRDAFNLPVQIIPATAMFGAAAFDAAVHDDDEKLDMMIRAYMEEGFLPAIFKGDINQAKESIKAHPLYAALEVSGAYAVAGRGAGAVARQIPGARKLAGTARPGLKVEGGGEIPQRYSANVLTKAIQKGAEGFKRRTGKDPFVASARKRERYLKAKTDRAVDVQEQIRRVNRDAALRSRREARPGKPGSATRRRGEGAVSLVVQRIVRRPDTWADDLHAYAAQLEAAIRDGALKGSERKAAMQTLATVNRAQRLKDPKDIRAVFESAQSYIDDHNPLVRQLEERGLLAEGQGTRAALFPYARIHMGAEWDSGLGLVTRQAESVRGGQGAALYKSGHLGGREGRGPKLSSWLDDELGWDFRSVTFPAARKMRVSKAQRAQVDRVMGERGYQAHGKWATGRSFTRKPGTAEREVLRPLSNEEILTHMKANGVSEPGFLTHRPGWRGKGSFYQPFATGRGRIPNRQRTGEAALRGTYDSSYDALVEQHALTLTRLDRARGYDLITDEFGLRRPDGSYWKTHEEAAAAARAPGDHGLALAPEEYEPWALSPFPRRAREEAGAKALTEPEAAPSLRSLDPDRFDVEASFADLVAQGLAKGEGSYVLIPRGIAKRLREHSKMSGAGERAFTAATGAFKKTVLPTSPKWMMGNIVEQSMRSIFAGLGLGDYALGRRFLRDLERVDPAAATRLRVQTVGGTHFSSVRQQEIHRTAADFGTTVERLAYLPPAKQLRGFWQAYNKYAKAVFEVNGAMERQPLFAALGKEVRREVQASTGRWHNAVRLTLSKRGRAAWNDLVKRAAVDTDAQIAYARAVEGVFGQWGKNSPTARTWLVNYAPFGQWARSAVRFVGFTLPRHHPVKTALIAIAEEMTEEERQALGFDLFLKSRLPEFMQGGIPGAGGGVAATQFYSSFGVWAGMPENLASFVLPQLSGMMDAFQGLTFTGDRLVGADGEELTNAEKFGLGLYLTAEAWIPMVSLARRVQERGESSHPASRIDRPLVRGEVGKGKAPKGSLAAGFERAFSPFPREYDQDIVDYLRSKAYKREIEIPEEDAPEWVERLGEEYQEQQERRERRRKRRRRGGVVARTPEGGRVFGGAR